MAIVVSCSGCSTRLTLKDESAGEIIDCPRCEKAIQVPRAGSSSQSSPTSSKPTPASPQPLWWQSNQRPALPGAKPPAAVESAPRIVPSPQAAFDLEPEDGSNKRVLFVSIAGGVVAIMAALLIAIFVFRKPAETASNLTESRPSSPAPASVGTPKPAFSTLPFEIDPTEVRQPAPPAIPQASPMLPSTQPLSPNPTAVPSTQYDLQFLGSQAQGRRFCIIADTSGSMRGMKIENLKTQLLKTLKDLDPAGEFFIYSFNSNTEAMPHSGWLRVGAPETERVRTWISNLRSTGSTYPEPAFVSAFKLSPLPDVIFFMTDGIIPPNVPAKVAEMNVSRPIVKVNTILFSPRFEAGPVPKVIVMPKGRVPPKGSGPLIPETALRKIADDSGGTFTLYSP